jgi:hypothetical protein
MKNAEIAGRKPRLTGIRQAATRLRKSPYQVMHLAVCGVLETEMVDETPKVVIASIERLEAALAADKTEEAAA